MPEDRTPNNDELTATRNENGPGTTNEQTRPGLTITPDSQPSNEKDETQAS